MSPSEPSDITALRNQLVDCSRQIWEVEMDLYRVSIMGGRRKRQLGPADDDPVPALMSRLEHLKDAHSQVKEFLLEYAERVKVEGRRM